MKYYLPLYKAKELAIREFGTAKGLHRIPGDSFGEYTMKFKNLEIEITPTIRKPLRIAVSINYFYYHQFKLFDFETLEELYDQEEEEYAAYRKGKIRDWVCSYGVEYCHKEIDRIGSMFL